MKSLRVLKAAGLVLAAVVLGLMTVQGSYALWNAYAPQNAGVIQAADFNIEVNEKNMGQTPNLALDLGAISRGTELYTSLRVTNKVNVTAESSLVIQPAITAPVPTNNLGGNLTVTTAVVPGSAACSANLPYQAGAPKLPVLATNTTQTICFKVRLESTAPASSMGQPVNIPVNLSVAQLAPAV